MINYQERLFDVWRLKVSQPQAITRMSLGALRVSAFCCKWVEGDCVLTHMLGATVFMEGVDVE